jgi:protein-tyrosine sulfotransferase
MIDHEGRNLIFILSTPRAGSTLLAALLGNHSRVLSPPEPWLLLPLTALRSNDVIIISHYDHELGREALNQLVDDEVFGQAANAFAVTVYNSLLEQAGKQVFVDKTPRYYHILPWLETVFPLAFKIWLNRNPLDVVASCKASWGFTIEELVGDALSSHSFDTTIGFALLASYFEAETPTKKVIRYEDLVQDPVSHVKALCESVGLPFEEGMLNYGENRALMKMYADAAMGDKKILEHTRTHDCSVGRWRDLLTPEEMRKVLLTLGRDLFMRLGYNDLIDEAAARAGINPAGIDEKGKLDQLFEQYTSYVDKDLPRSGGVQRTLIARQNAQLQAKLAEGESDRAARLEVIKRLSEQLAASEADRAARLEQIHELTRLLQESEADRAARLEVIHEQARRLGELEAELRLLNSCPVVKLQRKLSRLLSN